MKPHWITAICVLASCRALAADTIEVPLGGDIQAALDLAVSGDTVLLAEGTYQVTKQLVHTSDNITLAGRHDPESGSPLTVLDGTNDVSIIRMSGSVIAQDLVFTNGRGDTSEGGAITMGGGTIVRRCYFLANRAGPAGIASAIWGRVGVIQDCRFAENSEGPAIRIGYNSGSQVLIEDTSFSGNQGVIYCFNSAASSPYLFEFRNCSFEENSSFDPILEFINYTESNFYGCTFRGNVSETRNSVLSLGGPSYASFTDCSLTENLSLTGSEPCVATPDYGNGVTFVTLQDTTVCGNFPSQIGENWAQTGSVCISTNCDTDGDGVLDCFDECPSDPKKSIEGDCGCGNQETDSDSDGTPDCIDGCQNDPAKIEPGQCGCGVPETDTDSDGISDCIDPCPSWPHDCNDDGSTLIVSPGQSIQSAIEASEEGGTIQLRPGFYQQTLDFGTKNVAIIGDLGNPDAYTLDGSGASQSVVTIAGGQDSTTILRGLSIQGGIVGTFDFLTAYFLGGALYLDGVSPRVEVVKFRTNAAELGGAVFARGGAPRFAACEFSANAADDDGGAMYLEDCEAILLNCEFISNLATDDGGAVLIKGGQVQIDRTDFQSNLSARGAGLFLEGSSTNLATLVDCDIRSNIASDSGGGLFALAPLTMAETTVCDNLPNEITGSFTDAGDNLICGCPGDLDGDGAVRGGDLGLLFSEWGHCNSCVSDLSGDGIVDGVDLGMLFSLWGPCR